MNKKLTVIIGVVAAIILAGGGVLLIRDSDNDTGGSNSTTSTDQKSATNDSSEDLNQTAPVGSGDVNDTPSTNSTPSSDNPSSNTENTTITYADNGFSPASLSVASGTTVTIKNTSSSTLQFDSDPHPQHTANPELNVGMIAAGASKTFTVTTTGSHGFHDHLNSSQTGTLVVN